MSKIFPMVFYHPDPGENVPDSVNFDFIEGIGESLHTNKRWAGQACEVEVGTGTSTCAFKASDFNVSIIPAYVFLKRVNDKQAVLIKKIEGRYLQKEELLQEIADAAGADYEIGNSAISIDLDGDGENDTQVYGTDKQHVGLGFGSPLGAFFDCERWLPRGFCRMKIGYLVLILMIIIIGIVVTRKIIR